MIALNIEAQCAMCKAVVENGDVGMAEGVNSGITYLMVFPYILVGLLLFFIYRYRKTAKN
jgi:cobalamin biosynthesis protein CobD/CbiB